MSTVRPGNRWLMLPPQAAPAKLRIFCFPYAGAGASVYRSWLTAFSNGLQACAVQLPGRENRLAEPAFTELSSLIPVLVKELLPHLHPPFAFFGHSMGALTAFELTRALRRAGAPLPVHLFLSSYRSPELPRKKRPLHNLPESEFRQELRKLEGTPEAVLDNEELMDLVSPTLRADFRVCETYAYVAEDPLNIPISVFGARQDPEVDAEELNTWRNHTNDFRALQMFEGNHFYLHEHLNSLTKTIAGELTSSLGL